MNKSKVKVIIEKLANTYPDARPELNFSSEYELLVAVILSAQCTDKRVNEVTEILFKDYNTPEKMIALKKEELAKIILPCGLFNSKAEHILSATKSIIENFGGKVPNNYNDLLTLSGVGRKTANVVYAVAFGGDAIAVDTHVFRVSNRIGLAKAKTPLETEKQLMKNLDKSLWSKAHHYLIFHGRRACKARKPECETCVIKNECEYRGK
ncbi:MAG: endonuclease III [Clostridiales bacterium]|jgi:endonuclease-3|nr:endonuclease III [Clostridiales bacterium]